MSSTLEIRYSRRMKKAAERLRRRGKDMSKLIRVLAMLSRREALPRQYLDHVLHGHLEGCRECHIEPDWLLIYEIVEDELIVYAMDTGTHADIFGN